MPLDRIVVRLNVERTHTRETRGSRFLNNAHVLYRKCLFIVRNKYSARTYRSEWKLHALPPPALSCALDCTCIYLPIHCTCIYLPIHWTCIYLPIHCTCIYLHIHWTLVNLIKLHWNDLIVIDHQFSFIHQPLEYSLIH